MLRIQRFCLKLSVKSVLFLINKLIALIFVLIMTLYAALYFEKQNKSLIFYVTKPTQKLHVRAKELYLNIPVSVVCFQVFRIYCLSQVELCSCCIIPSYPSSIRFKPTACVALNWQAHNYFFVLSENNCYAWLPTLGVYRQ